MDLTWNVGYKIKVDKSHSVWLVRLRDYSIQEFDYSVREFDFHLEPHSLDLLSQLSFVNNKPKQKFLIEKNTLLP